MIYYIYDDNRVDISNYISKTSWICYGEYGVEGYFLSLLRNRHMMINYKDAIGLKTDGRVIVGVSPYPLVIDNHLILPGTILLPDTETYEKLYFIYEDGQDPTGDNIWMPQRSISYKKEEILEKLKAYLTK